MCIWIVRICGASSFSYRSTQHISTWLLANAFSRESSKSAQALLLQTRQDSYSAQPPQKRAHIIFVAAEREYCYAGRCYSLISLSLLQGREYCHASRCRHADKCHSLVSLSLQLLQGGVLPCQQVPLSQHSLPVAASPLCLDESVTAWGLT